MQYSKLVCPAVPFVRLSGCSDHTHTARFLAHVLPCTRGRAVEGQFLPPGLVWKEKVRLSLGWLPSDRPGVQGVQAPLCTISSCVRERG